MDEKRRSTKRMAGPGGGTAKDDAKTGDSSTVSNTPRKRVSQACDRCRSRKDKCDGGKPRCSTCVTLDQTCSYDPSTKKRGLPEGYVRGLEKLWGLTIREEDETEDKVLRLLSSEADADNDASPKFWKDQDGIESLQETWRKSRLSQELERLLPVLDASEDKITKRKRADTGAVRAETAIDSMNTNAVEKPGVDFKYLPQSSAAGDFGHFHERSVPQFQSNRQLPDHFESVASRISSVSGKSAELPPNSLALLEVYFSYTHCWLPIIERSDMLRTFYQYSADPPRVSPLTSGSGDQAALWAILAYAQHQNESINLSRSSPANQEKSTVNTLYAQSRGLVPLEDGAFEVGHVQALLILTLLNMGRDQWDRAWLLVGQAVRIAITIGLDEGVSASTSQSSKKSSSRRNHVFLGCFVLDTIVAAHLGRAPQLSNEDLKRVGIIEEDGSDEWNPWTDSLSVRSTILPSLRGPAAILSTFNRLIKLMKVLNTITRDISSGELRLDEEEVLTDKMYSLGQVLSSHLLAARDQTILTLLPHQYHLHLAHVSVVSAVHNHLSASPTTPRPATLSSDAYGSIARQLMWLLTRQLESFGLVIVPPTYDYYISVICETIQFPTSVIDVSDNVVSHTEWEHNMLRCLEVMATAWSTFEGRKQAFANRLQYSTHRPIITPDTNGPRRHLSASTEESILANQPSMNTRKFSFRDSPNPTMNSLESPIGPSATFTPSYDPLLNIQPYSGTSPWPDQPLAQPAQFTPTATNPSDHILIGHQGSISSDVDGDSMFNEFATLDAMEWANNWDQSLLNLGFTDPENMHSDFYAFAREPDPLYSTNFVQQLLSNNSTFANPSVISNPKMSQGLIMNNNNADDNGNAQFDNSYTHNSHVEAGHILQALSGSVPGQT